MNALEKLALRHICRLAHEAQTTIHLSTIPAPHVSESQVPPVRKPTNEVVLGNLSEIESWAGALQDNAGTRGNS